MIAVKGSWIPWASWFGGFLLPQPNRCEDAANVPCPKVQLLGQAEHVCPVGPYTHRNKLHTQLTPWTNREQCPPQHPHKPRRCSLRREQHRQPQPVTPLLLIRIDVHQRSHARTVQLSSDTSPRYSDCASAGLHAPSLPESLASGPTESRGSRSQPSSWQ